MSTHVPMGYNWPYQGSTVRHRIDIASGATLVLDAGTVGQCIVVHEYSLTSDGDGSYQWLMGSTPLTGPMTIVKGQLHRVEGITNGPGTLMAHNGPALSLVATGCRITGYALTYVVDMNV